MFHLLLQCSDKLGLSLELGSFVAGVMISTTDFAEHTLQQVSDLNGDRSIKSEIMAFTCVCDYLSSLGPTNGCIY